MEATAVFPKAGAGAGFYESFYLRAVSPLEPVGVWIRYTVLKRPGQAPVGSTWCTVFDARRGAPFMHKLTASHPAAPADAWIEVGGSARFGPEAAEGTCGPARWSLRFSALAEPLQHVRPQWLYRSPLPRTKLTSPAPLARFDGVVELPDRQPLAVSGWRGMVGHNWGTEHAERWIWLHGCQFAGSEDSWLDLAVGRIALAGRMTPWVANGVLCMDGARRRLGGLLGARPKVTATATGCEIALALGDRSTLELRAAVPDGTASAWRYADPDGGEHDVVNCSIASLRLAVSRHDGHPGKVLLSEHGGAYELGLRTPRGGTGERDHGVALAPFADG